MMVFIYTPVIIENLESSISTDRLSTYMQDSQNNKENALKLYLWNTEISAAFYMPLQSLEIALRNSLNNALITGFQTNTWYDTFPIDPIGRQKIEDAKRTVRRLHRQINPSQIVAELSFGFWLSLLNRQHHQSLWIPYLNKAFPHAHLSRADILRDLDHLRTFRNRIAHHEPIFKRHLEQDYKSIISAIGWICPDTEKWTDAHNSILKTLV